MSSEYLNNKSFESIIIRFQAAKKQQNKFKILLEDFNAQLIKIQTKSCMIIPLILEQSELTQASTDLTAAQKILADAFYTLSKNIVRYAKFSNIVDILDEMLICNIGRYAIVDISDPEIELIKSSEASLKAAGGIKN